MPVLLLMLRTGTCTVNDPNKGHALEYLVVSSDLLLRPPEDLLRTCSCQHHQHRTMFFHEHQTLDFLVGVLIEFECVSCIMIA